MSNYVTRAEIEAELPPRLLVETLDDDGDGQEDNGLFATICERASADVDGILGQRFRVPFASVPPLAALAARVFVLATLYRRRQTPEDRNPYAKAEAEMRSKLARIANGAEPLMPEAAKGEAFAETEPSRVHDPAGRIAL